MARSWVEAVGIGLRGEKDLEQSRIVRRLSQYLHDVRHECWSPESPLHHQLSDVPGVTIRLQWQWSRTVDGYRDSAVSTWLLSAPAPWPCCNSGSGGVTG